MKQLSLFATLDGPRLVLKKHKESLAPLMYAYIEKDRARLAQFLPWVPLIQTEIDELNWIKSTHEMWDEGNLFDYSIFRKSDDVYIGNIGVHSIKWKNDVCEIGYWNLGEFEGQGYISEALRVLEKHLFDLGFHRIEVRCSSQNKRSANVPIACGYVFDGVLKENFVVNSEYHDNYIFSKTSRQYQKNYIRTKTMMDESVILNIAKALPDFFTEKGVSQILSDYHNQQGLVYIINDKIVGFVLYYSNQSIAEIGWMGVSPQFQNNGVGKILIDELCRLLKKSGCASLVVKTLDESIEYKPYEKTRKFYLKNGFKKYQVLRHPENPECEAELILRMDISSVVGVV